MEGSKSKRKQPSATEANPTKRAAGEMTEGSAAECVGATAEGSPQHAFSAEIELLLPHTHIERIMKKILPSHMKVSPDAVRITQECVSSLAGLVSSEAGKQALINKRSLVHSADVVLALDNLGYRDTSELVNLYMSKVRKAKLG